MSQIQMSGSTIGRGDRNVEPHKWEETFIEQEVTYAIELDGKFIIVENVPARVCVETGERFFAPETVERLQHTVWERRKPRRVIETPVFEFAT